MNPASARPAGGSRSWACTRRFVARRCCRAARTEGDIEHAVPFPFVEALRTFVHELSDDGHLSDPYAGCAEVATIIPDCRGPASADSPVPSLDGDTTPSPLPGVSSFLRRGDTGLRPLVIVLDDMRFIDRVVAAARAPGPPGRIIRVCSSSGPTATWSSSDHIHSPRPSRAAAETGSPNTCCSVAFPSPRCRRSSRRSANPGGAREFAGFIFRETKGDPFFVAGSPPPPGEKSCDPSRRRHINRRAESIREKPAEGTQDDRQQLDGLSKGLQRRPLSVPRRDTSGYPVEVVGEDDRYRR